MTQRAAGVIGVGGPVTPLELPSPRELRDDEVLIDVRAAGVGDWDEIMRVGRWPSGLRPPHALGVEAEGIRRIRALLRQLKSEVALADELAAALERRFVPQAAGAPPVTSPAPR